MSLQLRAGESLAENLLRLARGLLDRVLAALGEHEPTAKHIHAARKDLKRLRALVRLARPGLGKEIFATENACFRDVGRALSAARDAQVLVEVVDRLAADHSSCGSADNRDGFSPDALVQVRAGLIQDREAVERRDGAGARNHAAREMLRAARARIETWPLHGDRWRLLGEGLRGTYRQGRRDLKNLRPLNLSDPGLTTPSAEDLLGESFHDLRKRVKHLGYQLRVFEPIWPRGLHGSIRELDELADVLGEGHDLAVLGARMLAHPELAGRHAAETMAFAQALTARRAALQAHAADLAQRLYAEKPGAFTDRTRALWRAWRREHPDRRP